MQIDRILVPLDASKVAQLAVEPAFELARHFGSAVHLLMVVEGGVASALKGVAVSEDVELERAAVAALEAVGNDHPGTTIEVAALFDEDPAHTIVGYAAKHGIDVIVMATHGRTGVGRWLLGSVAGKVLRSSPVPVFVVPAPKRAVIGRGQSEVTGRR